MIEHKLPSEAMPVPPLTFDATRDDHIQAADGYAFVMAIQPGDRLGCEFCNLTLKIPPKEIVEVPCEYCIGRGRDARFIVCYWPLDETLIDHLKSIDPTRYGGREMTKRLRDDVQHANDDLYEQRNKDGAREREAAGRYYFPHMFQIPSVGWTPNTGKAWRR